MAQHAAIPLDKFDADIKSRYVEVSTSALGAKVVACSDDFFVSRHNLIKPTPSISMKGQFGPNGALYDAWESRRHNPNFDWIIIKLAPHLSKIHYVDIDTSHFSGNEAPMSQVFGLRLRDGEAENPKFRLSAKDPRWTEILPVVELGPNSRHIFQLADAAREGEWGALMVRMIPDGGMARFRAYGLPTPPTPLSAIPPAATETINLLDPLVGGRIISCSDANFSPPGNLLLPTRGVDMSDGWETRRSQHNRGKYAPGAPLHGKERCEWVIARLAGTGVIRYVDVDTAYHPGNYPVACKVEAILCEEDLPGEDAQWTEIVSKKPLGPHRQHWFDVERNIPADKVYSHVRLTTFPDGGLKRLRIYGHPIAPSNVTTATSTTPILHALPLTVEAFKPYGDVIQGFDIDTSAPKGIDVSIANQGTAFKFHRLAKVQETYPAGALKRGGMHVCVARQGGLYETANGAEITVSKLERHAATTQSFIPMGKTAPAGREQLAPGGAYVVVAALNGADDKPDGSTLKAFLVTSSQGVSFHAGVWHHSMLTVDGPLDYAIVEAQVGEPGLLMDCEHHEPAHPFATVIVPPYTDRASAISKATDHSAAHSTAIASSAPSSHTLTETIVSILPSVSTSVPTSTSTTTAAADPTAIHPIPITPEAWAPFGSLIRAYPDISERGAGQEVQANPKNKVEKYTHLAPVLASYPADAAARTAISVFRATKKVGLERGKVFDVRLMERHAYTSQAFVPMGKGSWKDKGEPSLAPGGAFLVIVAKNGADDKPDPKTLQSFVMESSMGLSYAPGVWHHPVLVLDSTLDLACVETQISTGVREDPDERDCELIELGEGEVFGRVAVPPLLA